ncbi:sirohydrochlorin chelatase [Ethanoligenens sp.]|uniref:sirohydrochlorin chelatase n=1 Tax=Ethanoligenens sp. TaxID=2099655 RepID=UPI0039E9C9AC
MKGVLILAHGSREDDTEKTMDSIACMVKETLPGTIIETAYLQFRKCNLENGLENLIHQGADDILLIPYFLFSGVHIRHDIPAEIDSFLQNRKDVKITMGNTLGADHRLAEVLVDRIRQTL